MDQKLYIEHQGQNEQLPDPIQLLDDLVEEYGIKRVTQDKLEVLARESANGQIYEYHLQEPIGGRTLQTLMQTGVRFTLWVTVGETTGQGRNKRFHVYERFILRNLLPVRRMLTRSNHVILTVVTTDRLERTEQEPPTGASFPPPLS